MMPCISEQNNTAYHLGCTRNQHPLFSSQTYSQTSLQIFMFFSVYMKKGLMAPSRNDLNGLRVAVIAILFFSLAFFPSKSDGSMLLRDSDHEGVKQMKLVLGSTPPRCVNKCLSCKPCSAALVTSPHHRKEFQASFQRDESYYLLSWKCKCKGKYFQP
ncbi:hypothetical protein RGQ29_012788 [Quercus rubra]|uniref:Epidermal patterning factor-like protein n=1 Tax=Quercus rubra TaxID=3512 RepID=A0AAN7JB07_QUERU|nr:hypothetical protein RGQ29_012788 [Quercus rubra]